MLVGLVVNTVRFTWFIADTRSIVKSVNGGGFQKVPRQLVKPIGGGLGSEAIALQATALWTTKTALTVHYVGPI